MKRSHFFLFLISIASMTVKQAKAQDFQSGLIIGFNFTQVDGDNFGGFNKLGFTGGGFVQHPVGLKGHVQMELIYSNKGSRELNSVTETTSRLYKIDLHYIDLPLMYMYSPLKQLNIEGGLIPSVLIAGTESINFVSNEAAFRKFDLCYALGLKYQLTKSLYLGGRFSYSLLNIRKAVSIDDYSINSTYSSNIKQYNQVLSVLLSYKFR